MSRRWRHTRRASRNGRTPRGRMRNFHVPISSSDGLFHSFQSYDFKAYILCNGAYLAMLNTSIGDCFCIC